jgi:hypothetical protein
MPTLTKTKRTGTGRIDVALIGCSHQTAPVEIRERVTFSSEQAIAAAEELRQRGILDEAVVLSTCNRSELYGVPTEQGPVATDAMELFLTECPALISMAVSTAGTDRMRCGIFSASLLASTR